jgi:hypothetical protein
MGMHFSEFLGVSLAFTTIDVLVLPIHLSTSLTYMTSLTGCHFIILL